MRRAIFAWIVVLTLSAPLYPAHGQTPTCNGLPATGTEGTEGDDVFVGTEGPDHFNGGRGEDTICGLGGDDVLSGFLGDDYIDGGSGNDRLFGCDPTHGKSDVVVCYAFGNGETDVDTLLGGEGDDDVFGHLHSDSLDGGAGLDVLDGGEETDSCVSGERYARCETMDPPPPPPACSDGTDNDGDGLVDAADAECSRDRDPTEDLADDPVCFNGNDDDDDGQRDYPEDLGCDSFEDTEELHCGLPCPPPSLTIKARDGFSGRLYQIPEGCRGPRALVVKKRRRGRDAVFGRTETTTGGRWRFGSGLTIGTFYAVVPVHTYPTPEGDDVLCDRVRSGTITIRVHRNDG